MFVRLVVMDPKNTWMKCAGGANLTIYDESYIGDDCRVPPANEVIDHFSVFEEARKQYEEFHFPHINTTNHARHTPLLLYAYNFEEHISVTYLCAMTIGSTGWSGWHKQKKEAWRCQLSDLTKEGKQLYHTIQALYPKCTLYLQTWLDT